ncbi:MAG TPA: hypothetical protein VNX18_05410 [Bryobacteraceae bacterium]|nr:hypothetical protein [Bryobacteraceae bacterium]
MAAHLLNSTRTSVKSDPAGAFNQTFDEKASDQLDHKLKHDVRQHGRIVALFH